MGLAKILTPNWACAATAQSEASELSSLGHSYGSAFHSASSSAASSHLSAVQSDVSSSLSVASSQASAALSAASSAASPSGGASHNIGVYGGNVVVGVMTASMVAMVAGWMTLA